ncbi:hypothetical protein P691DRAFT_595036 [Macrolepiota fuliginosa MF-IS2]|uniref:Secreted protein n=1 Tax=Macrolepiota fuliginosa MF-IS2 TaxID=1400762 RepID=A0A9P5WZI1_9AGAR|nr:hypothetical protein P691DRAFT_595036 [Macrolepiota fuliginosa MF-IS2]
MCRRLVFPFPLCFTWTLLFYIHIVCSEHPYLSVHLFVVPVNSLDSCSIKFGTYLVLSLQSIHPHLSLIVLKPRQLQSLPLSSQVGSSVSKTVTEY